MDKPPRFLDILHAWKNIPSALTAGLLSRLAAASDLLDAMPAISWGL